MVNFSPLTAEICWRVWGTPANFNGFRVLATLLHGTLIVVGVNQPNFAALNRGRHLYAAGRLSRWALARILVFLQPLLLKVLTASVKFYFTEKSTAFFLLPC